MRISICVTLSALFASYNALPITDTMLQTRTAGHNYGKATYYNLATGNQVACGGYFYDSENVCAANPATYAGGNHCGKMVTIRHGDKSATCRLVDECPGCGSGGLDLSPSVFAKLGNLDAGVLDITWSMH